MKKKNDKKAALLAVAVMGFGVSHLGAVWADDHEFADDFSVNSLRYGISNFSDSSGIYSVDYVDGALRLSSTGNESGPGNANLQLSESTDRLVADVTLSSESMLLEQENYSGSNLFLEGYFGNDTHQSMPESGINEGDIWVQLGFGVDQYGNTGASYCLRRINAEGIWFDLGDFGTELCNNIEGSESLQLDTRYQASILLDRPGATFTLQIGELSQQVSLTGDLFTPLRREQRVQIWQSGIPGTAVGLVHGITTDNFADDFGQTAPVLVRYFVSNNYDGLTRDLRIENGRARLFAATNEASDGTSSELWTRSTGDYLEAVVNLSSSSTLSSENRDSRVGILLKLVAYNDIQAGGIDGSLGDVEARIRLRTSSDGRRSAQYCLFREDTPNFSGTSGLLGNDRQCIDFPLLPELDRDYRIAIALDRTNATMTFRLDGHTVGVPITTGIFDSGNARRYIAAEANDNASALVFVDNLRTAPEAITATEAVNGETVSPAFPDPVDPASTAVESTIAHPFDFTDYTPQLDFVDDFSGVTTDFGFSTGRDRGEAGVSWQDGAVVLENNSFADNDDGNWTEFYLNQPTDRIEAVVSLSSESRLPPSGEAEAQIQIRAVFYNDTQDFGFNDQEGDIEAVLQIRQNGDGRRRVRADLRRRDEGGNGGDDLLNDVEEVRNGLEAIVPNLDQPYRISLALDRENGVLRYTLDDLTFDYPIPTGIFRPVQLRTLISVNHRGSSGVAIGRIHSISTDAVAQDFSMAPPVFAPYPPSWNTQRPGRSATVVDGRLRLEADGSVTSGRDPGINTLHASDYVSATLELSSDSVVQPEGRVHVEVHGILYNDLPDGQVEGSSEGRVFSAVRLIADGNGELSVQHCAYRSNTADFSDSTELFGGDDDNCPSFPVSPAFDTPYNAFIKLDRENATLTYGFDGETVVYNIPTAISNARPFNGVRARTTDDSKVVAYVDDLAFAENPVPLVDSSSSLVADVTPDSTQGTDATTDNNDNANSDSSGGGSSGGGCSLSRTGAIDPSLPALLTLSLLFMFYRRIKR